eukprot:GHVH01007128.1.p1 GENE.GHVH01007128.1~~GHVH01007128.1.p1  ORF type:complete len:401 (+),score=37.41 GHVH01007128.1:36-1205(+)
MVVQGSGSARFLLNDQIIYFEKQGSDRLCGQHVINLLCQQPKISSSDLRKAATTLDGSESMLLGQNPSTQFKSENASADGYFNVSVLEFVLQSVCQISMTVFTNKLDDVYSDPSGNSEAFLVNEGDHWYCWRKIKNVWYELNSLRPAPEKLTHSELSKRISKCKRTGIVFYVYKTDGSAMPIPDDWIQDLARDRTTLGSHQKLMDEAEASKLFSQSKSGKIEGQKDGTVWSGEGFSLGASADAVQVEVFKEKTAAELEKMSEADQLQYVMNMSRIHCAPKAPVRDADMLEDQGTDPEDGCTIAVRLSKGGRHTRRFDGRSECRQVAAWLTHLLDGAPGKLITSMPPVRTYTITKGDIESNGSSIWSKPINEELLSNASSKGESFNVTLI